MKELRLKGFLMIACSFMLTVCTGQDSTRSFGGADFPKGVWISYDGFRKVLYERDSLKECQELLNSKMKIIKLHEFRIKVKDLQVTSLQNIRSKQTGDIKQLKKMVWRKNFEIWAWRGLVVVLGYKLIF